MTEKEINEKYPQHKETYKIWELSKDNQKLVDSSWNVKEENWRKYIESNWKQIFNENDTNMKDRKWKQHQFTNEYVYKVSDKYKWYVDKLKNFISWTDDVVEISDKYSITRDRLEHIYHDHWAFAPENLIETINNWDDVVKNPWWKNVTWLLKKIPWSNNFFRAVVQDNWVLTFFERVVWNVDTYAKELLK